MFRASVIATVLIVPVALSQAPKKAGPTSTNVPKGVYFNDADLEHVRNPLSPSQLTSLLSRYRAKPRGEFETSDEYRARMAKLADSLYYVADVPINGVGSCSHKVSYDADDVEYHVAFDTEEGGVNVVCFVKNRTQYVGQNGFGVKKLITKYTNSNIGLLTKGVDESGTFDVSVPRDSAAKIGTANLRLAVLFRPMPNDDGEIVIAQHYSLEPTISSPYEFETDRIGINTPHMILMLFDKRSGLVIGRHIIGKM